MKRLEELIQKLTSDQIDSNEVHAKELETHEKERKKELSNFHRIYAEKMERQERKYVVEILKMKEDKDYNVAQMKLLDAQYMEMMQKAIEFNQHKKTKYENLINKRESQHAKEIEEIQKVYADQAKEREEDCKKMTAEILTTQEKQQENH